MNKVFKKAFSLITSIFLFATVLSAQQNHFVYVQTENKQPFYIKLDKKVLSSSASGYLIIPKLQDGNYVFTVGFPKNEWPEQNVTCSVNKKDAGYLLKYFGDKGWGFFNLQTMEVIMPGTVVSDNKTAGAADKQDLFSNILSDVVNDPSIVKRIEEKPEVKDTVKLVANDVIKEDSVKLIAVVEKPEVNKSIEEKPVIKKEEPVIEKPQANKTTEEKPAIKKEEPVIEKPEVNQIVEDKPVVKKDEPVQEIVKEKETVSQPSIIKKLFSVKSSEGTDMVYADISNGQADTIRLFIPTEKKEPVPVIEVPQKEEIKKEEPKKEEVKKEEPLREESKKETIKKEEPKKEEIKKEETVKEEPKKEELKKEDTKANAPKFIDIELAHPNAKKDSVTKQAQPANTDEKADVIPATEKPKEKVSKPVMANSDCKNFASEEDFLKLRKKMAAADNDDDMLTMSKKAFKSKCFTTEQVKNLAVLFLKDEGKYKFFDVAYPFVSDSYNFGTLEGQLTDNYFISRFKAMIHH